jgi:hypothetical protein
MHEHLPLFSGRRKPLVTMGAIKYASLLGLAAVAAVASVVYWGQGVARALLLQGPQLRAARMSKLGYLLGKEDPPWVATKQQPLEYYESQSTVKNTKALDFWPGVKFEDVRPDRLQERGPIEGTAAWAPTNGRGIELINSKDGTLFSGDPAPLKHGFMGQMCTKSEECQNADVCKKGKCKPAIFDGLPAVAKAVKAAEKKKWPKTKSFGQQELRSQLILLHEITSQTAADEEAVSRLDADLGLSSGTMGLQKARRGPSAAGVRKARLQRLAMGGGTPVDLTFGVGRDGEPPYHLATVAESVRNGLLDPDAPSVLPYGRAGNGQMTAVGYLASHPEAGPKEIDGTVAA